jgi:hypothetical protein
MDLHLCNEVPTCCTHAMETDFMLVSQQKVNNSLHIEISKVSQIFTTAAQRFDGEIHNFCFITQ